MDIDDDFARPQSWPTRLVGMSRDYFERNKHEVMKAAAKHGYAILGMSRTDPEAIRYHRAQVEFIGQEALD